MPVLVCCRDIETIAEDLKTEIVPFISTRLTPIHRGLQVPSDRIIQNAPKVAASAESVSDIHSPRYVTAKTPRRFMYHPRQLPERSPLQSAAQFETFTFEAQLHSCVTRSVDCSFHTNDALYPSDMPHIIITFVAKRQSHPCVLVYCCRAAAPLFCKHCTDSET